MPQLMTLRVLWAAIVSSLLCMAGVARLVPVPAGLQPQAVFVAVFGAAALGCAVMSFVLPENVFRAALARAKLEVTEVADPNAAPGFGQASRIKSFADPKRAKAVATAAFQTAFILSLALSEAVGVFGFVLNRLGHPVQAWAPFFGAALLLLGMRFPLEEAVAARTERVTGARFEPVPGRAAALSLRGLASSATLSRR